MDSTVARLPGRPRLLAEVRIRDDSLAGGEAAPRLALERILERMDGSAELSDLARSEEAVPAGDVERLITALDGAGIIDDDAPVRYRSGADVILEVEELIERACEETIFVNPFWRACMDARNPGDLPEKLAVGMVIENWHFLFRESYFDAPVLSYVPSTAVRLLLNQFFSEEYGHDEILLRALRSAGVSREAMHDAIPLPETMALCNSLAYWAHTDPLFFFTTLGLLEGESQSYDTFIHACERTALPAEFVGPLKAHADINIKAAHGSLTRAIFKHIPALDDATVARLKGRVRLFVELYDDFYAGVWRYYTSDAPLLRRVSEL